MNLLEKVTGEKMEKKLVEIIEIKGAAREQCRTEGRREDGGREGRVDGV